MKNPMPIALWFTFVVIGVVISKRNDGRCPVLDSRGIFEIWYNGSRLIGSTAHYVCKDVTKNIAGFHIRTCQEDQNWSGSEDQKCIESSVRCPVIGEDGDLRVIYSDERKVNSIARYFCKNVTLIVSGTKTKVCLGSGQWSGPHDQRCIASNIKCPRINLSSEFIIFYNDEERKANSIARYFCRNAGQRLSGGGTRVCLETGEWSGPQDQACSQIACQRLPVASNMKISYRAGVQAGSIAKVFCKDPTGKTRRRLILHCLPNGTWNDFPSCENIKCKELNQTDLMHITYTDNQNLGSYAEFRCLGQGQRVGLSRIRCMDNGEWSNTVPTCKSSECSFEKLMNILPRNVIPNIENVNSEQVPEGLVLELFCEMDLILKGSPTVKCSSGEWKFEPNLSLPYCVQGCKLSVDPSSRLIVYPEKELFLLGEFVYFRCPYKYKLTKRVEKAMCLAGYWSDIKPDCEPI